MALAAVPAYLGRDHSQASPGLRFGMYLPLWGEDSRSGQPLWTTHDVNERTSGPRQELREFKDENKAAALRQSLKLGERDLALMRALAARQSAAAAAQAAAGQLLVLDAISTAPFTTGLGNEHPLENGFAFLSPYGLPYLPGSGVKGVLRQAARELYTGDWGDGQGWTDDAITHLFGLETDDGQQNHQRGALNFWDVLPQVAGNSLHVEVMTPHQGHYYQQRSDSRSGASTSPHDSGQPNPINFVTVPPGSRFAFHVLCDMPFLVRRAKDLAEDGRWQVLLQAAFELAFTWLGFGAKTAVGYGAMVEDSRARDQREAARARAHADAAAAAQAQALAQMSPDDAAWVQAQAMIQGFLDELSKAKAAGAYNPGGPFNQIRQSFLRTALAWTESRSRAAAGDALAQSATKAWGRPSNKDRWKELQDAISALGAA